MKRLPGKIKAAQHGIELSSADTRPGQPAPYPVTEKACELKKINFRICSSWKSSERDKQSGKLRTIGFIWVNEMKFEVVPRVVLTTIFLGIEVQSTWKHPGMWDRKGERLQQTGVSWRKMRTNLCIWIFEKMWTRSKIAPEVIRERMIISKNAENGNQRLDWRPSV